MIRAPSSGSPAPLVQHQKKATTLLCEDVLGMQRRREISRIGEASAWVATLTREQ